MFFVLGGLSLCACGSAGEEVAPERDGASIACEVPAEHAAPPLTDTQRLELLEIQANVDAQAALAIVEQYKANPDAFEEVYADSPSSCYGAASLPADGLGQTQEAISLSCKLANYGNPLWWQLVAVMVAAKETLGLTEGNCKWIMDAGGATIALYYGPLYGVFAGWSGRCACGQAY
jgi:hypothetical protein